jgi:replication factor A1
VYDRPQYRYIMSINVADHTGQMWLSCFDDSGRAIMGKSADEVTELLFDDQAKTAAFERGVCRTMVFRVRAKMDTYGETQR